MSLCDPMQTKGISQLYRHKMKSAEGVCSLGAWFSFQQTDQKSSRSPNCMRL